MLNTAAATPVMGAPDGAIAVQQSGSTADAAKRQTAARKAEKARRAKEDDLRRAADSNRGASSSDRELDTSADTEIMVVGVRDSMAEAAETKRNSDSIVDVVNAEDIGKLPNNTIGDVLSTIPGIAVTRGEGEVNDISLRGLGGVQTTIGGTPIESGADRVANIADLPADLVKSIEVYKTKTPDQVEGGGAGVINLNFRKPSDFKRGFTFVTNANGRYNNQSRKVNQSYTGVVNYRADTGIGTLGLQFGATVNFNPFLESYARNEAVRAVEGRQVVGPNLLPQPTFAPGEIAYLYFTGSRKTPTYNGSLQWKNEGNDITIDGTYASPRFDRYTNQLFMPVTAQAASTNALPALSNLVLVPGTNRLASATVSPVTQVGPVSNIEVDEDTNWLGRIRATHVEERFTAYAEIAVTGSERDRTVLQSRNRFVNRPVFDVVFASDKYRVPQMDAVFRDFDLLDPNQYRFFGVNETRIQSSNQTLSSQADLTLRLYDTMFSPLFEYLKIGARFSDRQSDRTQAARSISNLQIPLADMPEGFNKLSPIDKGFGGTGVENNARWLSYDRFSFRDNYDKLRTFLGQFPAGAAFQTEQPTLDQALFLRSRERNFSMYAMTHYQMKLLFPIDGILGVRATNTELVINGLTRRTRRQTVEGSTTPVTVRDTVANQQRGEYFFLQPTATAVVRFTPRFDLRLSYNVDFRRPAVADLQPYLVLDDLSPNAVVETGNPELKPQTTYKYDALLEWYFGRGRANFVTVNPFYWDIQGTVTRFTTQEDLNPGSGILYTVRRPYNTGKGYRRGVELQAQTFFFFLPGILKNFGVVGNYTFTASKLEFDSLPGATTAPPESRPLLRTPRNVFNVQGLFERGGLSGRVSYNWNGRMMENITTPIQASQYFAPRSWMDASVSYRFPEGSFQGLTMSIQMQNVLASTRRTFYGFPDQPRDVIYMARTFGGRIGYRF